MLRSSPVPHEVVAAVQELRIIVRSLDACKPPKLWRQFAAQLDDLQNSVSKTVAVCDVKPGVLNSALDYITTEGTLPGGVVHLLNRLLGSTDQSRDASPAQTAPANLQQCSAVSLLLGCLGAFLASTDLQDGETAHHGFLDAVAASRPCAAIAAAAGCMSPALMAGEPVSPALAWTRTAEGVDTLVNLRGLAVEVACFFIQLPSRTWPQAATLWEDVSASQLLQAACTSTRLHLRLMGSARHGCSLPVVHMVEASAQVLTFLCHHPSASAPAVEVGEAGAAAVAAASRMKAWDVATLIDPAVPRFLLQTVAYWLHTNVVASHATAAMAVLRSWCLTSDEQEGQGSLAGALRLSIEDLHSVVPAAASAADAPLQTIACLLLRHLVDLLPGPADRHRAFPALAAFGLHVLQGAQRELQRLWRLARSGPTAASMEPSPVLGRLLTLQDTYVRCGQAVALLLAAMEDSRSDACPGAPLALDAASAAAAQRRRCSRARWCLERGVLIACESALRTVTTCRQATSVLHPVFQLATLLWSRCGSDQQLAAKAWSHLLSLLVALRKLAWALMLPAAGSGTASPARPALPESSGAAPPRCTPRARVDTDVVCLVCSTAACTLEALSSAPDGPPGGHAIAWQSQAAALRAAALHLLPPLVHLAQSHRAWLLTSREGEATSYVLQQLSSVLRCVPRSHPALAATTAALGVPALVETTLAGLARLPRSAAGQGDAWRLGARSLATLLTAQHDPAWLRNATQRCLPDLVWEAFQCAGYELLPDLSDAPAVQESALLGKVEQSRAWWSLLDRAPPPPASSAERAVEPRQQGAPAAGGGGEAAPVWRLLDSPPSAGQEAEALEVLALAMAILRDRLQALPAATRDAAAPSWDFCLLGALAVPSGSGCVSGVPGMGCCHVRCRNLAGSSELSLRVRRCGGCHFARYCSQACQRKAWRAGHRTACQEWQRNHSRGGGPLSCPSSPSSNPA